MPDQDKPPEDITSQLEELSKQHNDPPEPVDDDVEETESEEPETKGNVLQRFKAWYVGHKKKSIPLTVLLVLAVLFGLPWTRYALLGLVIQKDVAVIVTDSQTNVPVSGAQVSLRGLTTTTDGQGEAHLNKVKVGPGRLSITKKYYQDANQAVTVPLGSVRDPFKAKLVATGRQLALKITDKITGAVVAGATITAAGTEAKTDTNGAATLVVPADQPDVTATFKATGYNDFTTGLTTATTNVASNSFSLTPSGKLYFLSKQSGKIDVVKTDLDGLNREVILPGTGSEEDANTVLLASRDWKYLALLSRRDGTKPRLYLLETSNSQLTEIDSGDATFSPAGWSGHHFIYRVDRNNVPLWQSKTSALKSYNAEAKQLTTLDETNAEGTSDNDYVAEAFDTVYIFKDQLVYTKHWNAGYYSAYRLANKRMGIYTNKTTGEGKQTVKDFDVGNNGYINAVLAKPDELYLGVVNGSTSYYEYTNGHLSESKEVSEDSFNTFYPTFLISPGGNASFWYEPRDGKNTLFTGGPDGSSPRQLATLSEYTPYGWYTDKYLLVSKGGSELYIMPSGGDDATEHLLKVADYHKPATSFAGYGYGYGGQ